MIREKYDVAFFLKLLEPIPEEQWATGKIGEGGLDQSLKFCVLGHCQVQEGHLKGKYDKTMQHALFSILRNPVSINDGKDPNFQQQTPKLRILAALRRQLEYQKYNNK